MFSQQMLRFVRSRIVEFIKGSHNPEKMLLCLTTDCNITKAVNTTVVSDASIKIICLA